MIDRLSMTGHRKKEKKMSKKKFEHKDELDCEVTVFEGSHSTCEKSEDGSPEKRILKKNAPSGEERVKDNHMI